MAKLSSWAFSRVLGRVTYRRPAPVNAVKNNAGRVMLIMNYYLRYGKGY